MDPSKEPIYGMGDGHHPPPTHSGEASGGDSTMVVPGTTRAGTSTKVKELKELLEKKTFATSMYKFVTVKGVKLDNSRMTRKEDNKNTTSTKKVKKEEQEQN